ncbi:MAG: carboxynorspermidine decarboxylase [Bacteroidia bacterium]|nr:carboxynorspermidine decarboxylase [Bacteroidia bacterium]
MIDYNKIPSPCFLMEDQRLKSNLVKINSVAKEAGIDIILALKAFANWTYFPLIGEYLHGATASSLHEARLIFEQMTKKAHVYTPALIPEEFDELLTYTSHLTFNSFKQFQTYKERVNSHQYPISMGIRVNPEASASEVDMYNPSLPGTRFGVMASQMPAELPEEIEGLHFHVLCEASSYDLEKVLAAFEERFAHYLPQIKWLNMGGGHLITREGYDAEHLIRLLSNFRKRYDLKIILEPGSAIAWETGVLVSRVLDIVENHNIKTAILDVSFTAHMPDTLEMPYQPRVLGADSSIVEGKHAYKLGGSSCLSGDFMGDYSFENELKIGDPVILMDMMHYTTVKTTMFNGIKHPNLGRITEAGEFEMIREFGYEDYKSRLG